MNNYLLGNNFKLNFLMLVKKEEYEKIEKIIDKTNILKLYKGIEIIMMKWPLNDNNFKILFLILKKTKNYNFIIKKKKTIWMQAIKKRDYATIESLLKNGAKINFKINHSHAWTYYFKNKVEDFPILNMLISNSINLKFFDNKKFTPLMMSIKYNYIFSFDLICKNSAEVINFQNNVGETALHWACKYNNSYCVKVLLSMKADFNILNNKNKKPIDLTHNIKIRNFIVIYENKKENKLDKNLYSYSFNSISWTDHSDQIIMSDHSLELINNYSGNKLIISKSNKIEINNNKNKKVIAKKNKKNTRILKLNFSLLGRKYEELKIKLKKIEEEFYNKLKSRKYNNLNFYRAFKINYGISLVNINYRFNLEIKHYNNYINQINNKYKKNDKELIEIIKSTILEIKEDCEIIFYGSNKLKLNLPHSDIDLCIKNYSDKNILSTIKEKLKVYNFETKLIINTQIPILKIKSNEKFNNRKMDLTLYNPNLNYKENIDLIKNYWTEYNDLRTLARLLKEILYNNSLNDPFKGGLGSYTLILMIVSFYQNYEFDNNKKFKSTIFGTLIEFLKFIINFNNDVFLIKPHVKFNININPIQTRINSSNKDILIIIDPLNIDNNVSKSSFKFNDIKLFFKIMLINIIQLENSSLLSIMNYDKIKNFRYKYELVSKDTYKINLKNYYFLFNFFFRKINIFI